MIPLIGSVEEFDNQKAIVVKIADEVLGKAGLKHQHYLVGTMIEIPRAALLADKVAKSAQFFSFGTNDLTQTTMGLSRDDYTKFQKSYEDQRSSRPIRSLCSIRKASVFWSRWLPGSARRRGRIWKSESAASTVVSRVRSGSVIGRGSTTFRVRRSAYSPRDWRRLRRLRARSCRLMLGERNNLRASKPLDRGFGALFVFARTRSPLSEAPTAPSAAG
jgi:hypothetical protein